MTTVKYKSIEAHIPAEAHILSDHLPELLNIFPYFAIRASRSYNNQRHRQTIVLQKNRHRLDTDPTARPEINMKIEWASHFNPDGTPRRPPASTMHGWLAKMRGTIIGDEELRSRGMREMKEARAKRKYKAGRATRHQHSAHTTGKSLFSFLGFGAKKGSKPTSSSSGRRKDSKKLQQRSSTRPTTSRQSTARSGGGGQASRPPTSRRSTGQRSHRPTPTPRPSYASGRRRSDKKN